MTRPHLKEILVSIKPGLFPKGYVTWGFSEDRFGLEWRWDTLLECEYNF